MNVRLSALAGSLLLSSIAAAQYDYYTSSTFGGVTGVSNNRVAIGTLGSQNGLWRPNVSATPTGIGGVVSGSPRISADGLWVGGTSAGPDGRSEISRYDVANNLWTPLGGAGGYSGTARSSAWGISGDGSTVIGFGYGAYTGTGTGTFTGIRPISVKGGVVTDYSIIPNANSINRLQAVNTDGTIVAGRMRETATTDGVFWFNNGVRTPMYATGTTFLGDPTAMSGDGATIGGSGNFATETQVGSVGYRLPYIYDTATGTHSTIDQIAGVNGNSIPGTTTRIDGFLTGMSADGNTAVGFFRAMSPSVFIDKTWGFIWQREVGVQSIDLWAASRGITGASSHYLVPLGISADGNNIVGSLLPRPGTTGGGGFMIAAVPEPGTIAALGLGAAALMRRRRKP